MDWGLCADSRCKKLPPLKTTIENIIEYLKDQTGVDSIHPDTDLSKEAGLYGDDWHEIMDDYSTKYSVDMSSYLWYFHTREEGSSSIGQIFFSPPNDRVEQIIITPNILHKSTLTGAWIIEYPEHKIPEKRYDILINQILFVITLIALIIWFIF